MTFTCAKGVLHILTMVKTSIMRMHMRFCSREITILITSDGTLTWVHLLFSHPVYQVLQYRTHPLSLTSYFKCYGFILESLS